jgi:hypothetical protein
VGGLFRWNLQAFAWAQMATGSFMYKSGEGKK